MRKHFTSSLTQEANRKHFDLWRPIMLMGAYSLAYMPKSKNFLYLELWMVLRWFFEVVADTKTLQNRNL